MSTPYKYADKVMKSVYSNNKKRLNNMRLSLAKFDELNIITTSKTAKSTFKAIYNDTLKAYLLIAKHNYPAATKKMLLSWLEEVYIVVGYQFEAEYYRKVARFVEEITALVQSGKSLSNAEMLRLQKKELWLFNTQLDEFAVFVTDKAVTAKLESETVEKVKWITQKDSHTCSVCRSRNGKVYDIEKVPPKPHIHCRCYIEEVK